MKFKLKGDHFGIIKEIKEELAEVLKMFTAANFEEYFRSNAGNTELMQTLTFWNLQIMFLLEV